MKTASISTPEIKKARAITKSTDIRDFILAADRIQQGLFRDGFSEEATLGFLVHLASELTDLQARAKRIPAGKLQLQAKLDYVEKFRMKMSQSSPKEAADWIEGINRGTLEDWKEIWYEIRNEIDWTRMTQDLPDWCR